MCEVRTSYKCVDAARAIPSDAAVHGGLTIIRRDSDTIQKRLLDNSVSTLEYLYTYATSKLGRFVLFSLPTWQPSCLVAVLRRASSSI